VAERERQTLKAKDPKKSQPSRVGLKELESAKSASWIGKKNDGIHHLDVQGDGNMVQIGQK